MGILLWIENIINILINRFINNPSIIITWIIGIVVLVTVLKVANKILKIISSIVFILFMLVRIFGLETIFSFIR